MVQRGAREHFLVARAFAHNRRLQEVVVDYFGGGRSFAAALGRFLPGSAGARARSHRIVGIPECRIADLGFFGVVLKCVDKAAAICRRPMHGYLLSNQAFGRAVARRLRNPPLIVFGYSYAALEAFESRAFRGCVKILGQIDPAETEEDLVEGERQRWPEYEKPGQRAPALYWQKNRKEWELADAIVVNSQWSARAIIDAGADPAKVRVVPLAYELPAASPESTRRPDGSNFLEVLWLGTVCLRKGIPYLLEAARRLVSHPVRFTIAGPVQIDSRQVAASPPNVRWLGPVDRDRASQLYLDADLFVIPTISDGFAITQIEAMAHGLPVIATENCGDVVVDGVNGFRTPLRDPIQLADRVSRFVRDRDLAHSMRSACLETSKKFRLSDYAERLEEIVGECLSRREP